MASYLGLDPARNYSLFTIPATFVLIIGTHAYATLQTPKSYDNTYPRSFKDNIEKDQTIDLARKQRAIRAEAASQNGFETLGFYAAAVVAANHARLPVDLLNHATLAYVASRLLYTLSYVQFKPTPANSVLRSSVWWVGIGVTSYLWIKAGQVIMHAVQLPELSFCATVAGPIQSSDLVRVTASLSLAQQSYVAVSGNFQSPGKKFPSRQVLSGDQNHSPMPSSARGIESLPCLLASALGRVGYLGHTPRQTIISITRQSHLSNDTPFTLVLVRIFLNSTTGISSIMTTRILLAFLFAAAVAFAAPHARFVEDGIYNHDPSVTAAPTPPIHCDNKICDGKTEWCFYWAGVTSYDQSLGPVPGVTRTALGPCPPATFASYLTAV
ncbi:hypothetical protein S40288_02200 [Stachybotrys chartarum IBT 40288]|nr:hypothetical protein S40288_02200 [Stachybotrys chartarum IBT 40288]